MRKGRSFFKRLFRRPRQYCGVIDILYKLVDTRLLQEIVRQTPDRRCIIETAARLLGKPEGEVGAQVAQKLGITYLSQVSPVDVDEVGGREAFLEFRSMGAIPIVGDGIVLGVACVDPEGVYHQAERYRDHRLYLAPWRSIAAALDESERFHSLNLSQSRAQEPASSDEWINELLLELMTQAERFGSSTAVVSFDSSGIRYRFSIAGGKCAEGMIEPKVEARLRSQLDSAADTGSLRLTAEGGFKELLVQRDGSSYTIKWAGESESQSARSASRPQILPFPARPRAKSEVQPEAKTAIQVEQSPTMEVAEAQLLIIEDNDTFAKVLENFFAQREIRVTRARNGEEALIILRAALHLPDLVVCDVHMPIMNGFSLLYHIRQDERLRSVPVLVLSSDDDLETEVELISNGADGFICKDRDPRILCAHVQRILQQRGKKRQAA